MKDSQIRCDFCNEVIKGAYRNRHSVEQPIRLALEDVPSPGETAKQFCCTEIDICQKCFDDWCERGFDDDPD